MERQIASKLILFLLIFFPIWASAEITSIKYNTATQCAPIVVTNNNDELQSTITASSVTVSVKEGITGTWVDLTLTGACTNAANTWCEEDATKAKGVYRVCFATTTVDTKGYLYYSLRGTSIKTRYFSVPVTTYAEDEVVDKMPSSGTIPNTTTAMLISDGAGTGQLNLTSGAIDACTSVTNGVTLANDAIDASKIAAGAIGNDEFNVTERFWPVYNVIDLTNESGNQNPTTTTFDTDFVSSNDITLALEPIIYFPTLSEEPTQDAACNVSEIATKITAYNTTTKVVTVDALPVAPDYRCKFWRY